MRNKMDKVADSSSCEGFPKLWDMDMEFSWHEGFMERRKIRNFKRGQDQTSKTY